MSLLKKILLAVVIVAPVFGAAHALEPGSGSDDGGDVVNFSQIQALTSFEAFTIDPESFERGSRRNVCQAIAGSQYFPFTPRTEEELVDHCLTHHTVDELKNLASGRMRILGQIPFRRLTTDGVKKLKMFNNTGQSLCIFQIVEQILYHHYGALSKDTDNNVELTKAAFDKIQFVLTGELEFSRLTGLKCTDPNILKILDAYHHRVYVDRNGIHIADEGVDFFKLFQDVRVMRIKMPGNVPKGPLSVEIKSTIPSKIFKFLEIDGQIRISAVDGLAKSLTVPVDGSAEPLKPSYEVPVVLSATAAPSHWEEMAMVNNGTWDHYCFLRVLTAVVTKDTQQDYKVSFGWIMKNIKFERATNGILYVAYSKELEAILRKYKGKVFINMLKVFIRSIGDSSMMVVDFFNK